jgi:pimeloyl-ACP methyl ester carboxylesterase
LHIPTGGRSNRRQAKVQCRELGRQNLKNISRPVEVYSVNLDEAGSAAARVLTAANLTQDIRYCRAADGVRLAYAKVGSGTALLRSAHWLGHLEFDWELPILRHFLLSLASNFSLVRYDARGNGLSDWDVGEVSLDAWVNDMETVADAAGLDRFPLLGVSQGCAVSIAFAVGHPERVTHLILLGGFATGVNKNPNLTPADRERFAAMKTLMKLGWGSDDPTFRQFFTSSMIPGATKEQADAFNELQRISASPACAVRYIETVSDFDVRHLLPKVAPLDHVPRDRIRTHEPIPGGLRVCSCHFSDVTGRADDVCSCGRSGHSVALMATAADIAVLSAATVRESKERDQIALLLAGQFRAELKNSTVSSSVSRRSVVQLGWRILDAAQREGLDGSVADFIHAVDHLRLEEALGLKLARMMRKSSNDTWGPYGRAQRNREPRRIPPGFQMAAGPPLGCRFTAENTQA